MSERIAEIGRALYGDDGWRGKLAAALNVDQRTLRRWEIGAMPVPPNVWIECDEMLAARRTEIDRQIGGKQ